jgi:1,4-alpha-glucan branching enzyme
MPASQDRITPNTPLGATLVAGGATFRVWAPDATAVHVALHGDAQPPDQWAPSDANRLVKDAASCWAGFFPGVGEGARYRLWTVGAGGSGYKRDPRARELELNGYPDCDCIVRGDPDAYPWHDDGFRAPPFHEWILYQLHIGVFYASDGVHDLRPHRVSRFLDAIDRIEYLADLGVTAIQPLPVVEWQGEHSRGYNNTDFFSPEMDYAVASDQLGPYLIRVNDLLRRKGRSEVQQENLLTQEDQLKALVDLCHVYGIAVVLDVVYNHAGGPFDDQSLRFFDRPANHEWWDPDCYFLGGDGWAGGRVFDYGRDDVRQFLIDNGRRLIDEFHVDGFRYDEVSVTVNNGGSRFCRDLTSTLRYHKPEGIHIAEYWNWDRATAVMPAPDGLGFDAALHDGLRGAVRGAIGAAAAGASAFVDFDAVRDALRRPEGFPAAWKAVIHLENHDLVDADRDDPSKIQPRVPALAHWDDRRDWLARSRSRVATALLLTAPGIPMFFMGEEFLEDKPWHNSPDRTDLLIYWAGLDTPGPMRDFRRFTGDLCRLRRGQPALTSEQVNPYYTHNANRILACHRWIDGVGRDVLIVASLNESTWWSYVLPFPIGGYWAEVFNSDAYDTLPPGGGFNPNAAGNPGGVTADGPGLDGWPTSAALVIPANGVLVFARR